MNNDSVLIENAANSYFKKKINVNNKILIKSSKVSGRFLKKLRKEENRIITKLKNKDSIVYRELLNNNTLSFDSIQKLSLNNDIKNINHSYKATEKILDSLGIVGRFAGLSKNQIFDKLLSLKDNLNKDNFINQNISKRIQLLNNLISESNCQIKLKQINGYYQQYNQQTIYWKNLFNQPDKLEEKVFDFLRGIEGFEEQIEKIDKRNERIKGKSSEELKQMGFQLKEDVNQELRNKFGSNWEQFQQKMSEDVLNQIKPLNELNEKFKEVKQKSNKLKNNIKEVENNLIQVSNSVNNIEGFKNPMRGIPFWHRWKIQYHFRSTRAVPSENVPIIFQTGVNFSYYPFLNFSIGGGIDGSFGIGSDWTHLNLSYEGVTSRIFIEQDLLFGISLQGAYEKSLKPLNKPYNKYQEEFGNNSNIKTQMGLLQDAAYIGIIKSYRISKKINGNFLIGYNFLNDKTRINSPWIIRLGWKI